VRSHVDRGDIDPALIQAECIAEAWPPHNIDFLVGSLGAVALVAALSREIAFLQGVMWLCSVVSARWFSCLLAKNLARHRSGQRRSIQRRLIVAAMVEGALWGSAPMVLHVGNPRYEVFVFGTILAVSIISALANSAYIAAAVALTAPLNVMLTIWLLRSGGHWGFVGFGGVVLVYGMTLHYMKMSHDVLRRSVGARLQVSRLADELELARAEAEMANQELQARNTQLTELARRDALTGLFNRRHFLEWLDRVRVREVRTRPWFLVILDVDFFKRINDNYGHQAGDHALVAISAAANAELRWTDCLARIGGEEFGLILQDLHLNDAVAVVERIRASVAAIDFGFGPVTLSAGLVVGEENMGASIALAHADRALYLAKHSGRDRLVCDPPFEVVTATTTVSTSTTKPTEEEGSERRRRAGADTAATRM
jgi:diguanylate cyclase (GGDEF)-like protein